MSQMNRITLEQIKEILCPDKTNKDFVNLIFKPLKDNHQLTFTDSFGEKHLSAFMKGNHNGQKRLNVRKLKLWSELICDDSVVQQMKKPLAAIVESCGVDRLQRLYQLLAAGKREMPDSLIDCVESCGRSCDHGMAVLLIILWSIYGKEQIDLLHPLYQREYSPQSQKNASLLSNAKPCRPIFKGREEVLEEIYKRFSSGSNFLFLQGMGGIGKSECAKQYARKHQDQYGTVVFAEYSDSIIRLVNDNHVFTLTEPFISERMRAMDGTLESDMEFYQRKLTQLRLVSDSRTLIILDNLDQYDEALEDLLAGPFHVLITTRWQSQSIYPQDTVMIHEIEDMKTCKEIFSAYYGHDISDNASAEKLIALFQGHTMALELIAKQMKASCLTPEEMLKLIQENSSDQLTEEFLMPNHDKLQHNMTRHIQKLFDIAGLTKTEQYILMCLSLLPLSGMEKRSFKLCCGLTDYSAVNNLIARSWIHDFDGRLSMHTLVKETVQLSCKPDLIGCKCFTDGLMSTFTAVRCYHAVRQDKDRIEKITSHIYNHFPDPADETLCDFYEWMELIFSHCCQYEVSMELSEKLHGIYQEKYGDGHFRTARMLCRIACGLIHFYRNKEAIALLERGRSVIRYLENRTVMQELYISDIDFTLSNQYLEFFSELETPVTLEYVEELCHETIAIRKRLCNDVEDKLLLSCVVLYRNLAWIEIIRRNYDRAAEYLEKSLRQCDERGGGFSDYFRSYTNYVQALYENSRQNTQGAIRFLQQILKINRDYFGENDARTVCVHMELASLYQQLGEDGAAYEQYQIAYDHMKIMPHQDETLLRRAVECMKQLEEKI